MTKINETQRTENSGCSTGTNDARRVYWVSPLLGDWDITRAGTVQSHHGRKRDAVRAAARLARADRPSVLKIQRRDGSIESMRSYGYVGRPVHHVAHT